MQLRTVGSIELREDGLIYETMSNEGDDQKSEGTETKIGAIKVNPEEIEKYYFYQLTLSQGVIFESIIKMLINYPSIQKTNPFFKNILEEYKEVKDKECGDPKTYAVLLFEQYIIDNVESFQSEPAFYGYSESTPDLRYDILFENIHSLLKLPVVVGNIINIYCDEENQPIDSAMFDYYNLDFITFIKTLLLNTQEGGTPEEKAQEKIEFMKEVSLYEEETSKHARKLTLVKKDKPQK
jgi:hypothetical protein